MTHFSAVSSPRITGLSLSPDESNLAFWIDTEFKRGENFDWQLGILDIQSGAVQLFCFSPGKLDSPNAPVWSPDGKNVMVTKYDENEFANAEVLLIKLVSNEIFSIQKNAVGISWLIPGNPPEN